MKTMYDVQKEYISVLEQHVFDFTETVAAFGMLLDEIVPVLQFYADIKYDHTMGVAPEAQWLAKQMINKIRAVNEERNST